MDASTLEQTMQTNDFKWHGIWAMIDIVMAAIDFYFYVCISATTISFCLLYVVLCAFFLWRGWYHGMQAWKLR